MKLTTKMKNQSYVWMGATLVGLLVGGGQGLLGPRWPARPSSLLAAPTITVSNRCELSNVCIKVDKQNDIKIICFLCVSSQSSLEKIHGRAARQPQQDWWESCWIYMSVKILSIQQQITVLVVVCIPAVSRTFHKPLEQIHGINWNTFLL